MAGVAPRPPVLRVDRLNVSYGPVQALFGVSLQVGDGEVVTLVGANGAGKTTLLRAISGVLPAAGRIEFRGGRSPGGGVRDIAGLPPEDVVRLGIAHVPEGRRIFPGLSVIENLEVAGFALGHASSRVRANIDRVLAIFPPLAARRRSFGWSLSGGEQQMLAIGRGLMADPRLLLLDEPSLGLAPRLVDEVFGVLERIRAAGATILLVEQNAAMALQIADRGYVLENGRVVKEGRGADLLRDPAVAAAYLGGTAT